MNYEYSNKLDFSDNNLRNSMYQKYNVLGYIRMIGDIERESKIENAISRRNEINNKENNPEEIFSMNNTKELEYKENIKGLMNAPWMETQPEFNIRAPPNDIVLIKQANASARKFEDRLTPAPAETVNRNIAENLRQMRDIKEENARRLLKVLRKTI